MVLFDVPGWSLPSAPSLHEASKKRKRPTSTSSQLLSTEINIEKIVERLKKTTRPATSKSSAKDRISRSGNKSKSVDKKIISRPKPLAISGEKGERPAKKQKIKRDAGDVPKPGSTLSGEHETNLTPLQKDMKRSLGGARFRMINEDLYKSDSRTAYSMMQKDRSVYEDYHVGFRHQVQSWPTNPVEYYVTMLARYPPKTVIADLGCGDAALARALIPKDLSVLSFDLVSDGVYVIEADTCSKIPLPGSEGAITEESNGEGQIVDVVVCALSLMGTNWPNCLREAWRILKPLGELKIAEVTSRFTDVGDFQSLVSSIGFRLRSKNNDNTHFTLFEFTKLPRKGKAEKEWTKILSKAGTLKPCEYKRR